VTAAVDAELESRIAELAAARRPVLAELVRQAVDRELVALVDRELEAALERLHSRDGAPAPTMPVDPPAEVAAEPCSRCHAEPRLRGRTIGWACKAADDNARAEPTRRSRSCKEP
jgi:hypothetical protein